jgi:predicted nucleotidyltransferase
MDRHLKNLLSALNARAVRYVVVGSYALAIHAQPRATGDLDVLVDTSPENAQAVFDALAEFGAPLQGLTPKDFQDPDSIFQIGISPVRVDIIKRISGLDFETVWISAVPWTIDGQVTSKYISEEHFIQNKLAVGRLQDLADVEAVRQAQSAKNRNPRSEEK